MAHLKPFIGIPLIAWLEAFLRSAAAREYAATLDEGRLFETGQDATSFASRLRRCRDNRRPKPIRRGIERQRRRSRLSLPTVPGARRWYWEPDGCLTWRIGGTRSASGL